MLTESFVRSIEHCLYGIEYPDACNLKFGMCRPHAGVVATVRLTSHLRAHTVEGGDGSL